MKNCVLLHLHHQDLWPEFWAYLENIKNENLDIFVTVNNPQTEWYEDIVSKCTDVFLVENKGMDFGGFLFAYNKIKHIDYKLIIKLHGKKRNPYLSVPPDEWRKELYKSLISSKEAFESMTSRFEANDRLYMYGSKLCYRNDPYNHPWMIENIAAINAVNRILNLNTLSEYKFIAGTMFAVSKTYLELLFNNKEMEIYNILQPYAPNNGSVAHGLERLIGANVGAFGGVMELI